MQLFDVNSLYIYRLCLTGGPCAGKTSSLDHLTKALTARGFDVYCCPEIPTILLNGGCRCASVCALVRPSTVRVSSGRGLDDAAYSQFHLQCRTGVPLGDALVAGFLWPAFNAK